MFPCPTTPLGAESGCAMTGISMVFSYVYMISRAAKMLKCVLAESAALMRGQLTFDS